MTPDKLVLLLLDAYGGKIRGRTLLQKRAYFVGKLDPVLQVAYRPHYYGPFSSDLEEGLLQDKARGLVEERAVPLGCLDAKGFEARRYDYALSDDGRLVVNDLKRRKPDYAAKIVAAVDRLKEAGDVGDYVSLSVAAKALHVLTEEKRPLTEEKICAVAAKLGWKISEETLQGASGLLLKLGLVEKRER